MIKRLLRNKNDVNKTTQLCLVLNFRKQVAPSPKVHVPVMRASTYVHDKSADKLTFASLHVALFLFVTQYICSTRQHHVVPSLFGARCGGSGALCGGSPCVGCTLWWLRCGGWTFQTYKKDSWGRTDPRACNRLKPALPFERVRVLRSTVSAWTCEILAGPHHHGRSDRPLKQERNVLRSNSSRNRVDRPKPVFNTYHGHVHVAGVQLKVDLLVNASLALFVVVLTAQRHFGRSRC